MSSVLHKLTSLPWVICTLIIALLATSPLYFIFSEVNKPAEETWELIAEEIGDEPSPLYNYIKGSVIMLAGVATLTLFIGVGSAWLLSVYRFRGRKLLTVLLSLPIVIPSYVMAVMYNEILNSSKTSLFIWIREIYSPAAAADFSIYWKFALGILVLSFSFYPYVFLAAKMSFARQSSAFIESSQVLGRGMLSTFLRIALPLARPGVFAGLTLALLETMNEFGAMKILGIETLTTGVFSAWLDFGELNSAVRISAVMLLIIFLLLILERFLRGGRKYHMHQSSALEYSGQPPKLLIASFIWISCTGISFFAFLLPVFKLIEQALLALPERDLEPYLALILSSSWLAIRATLVIILLAIVLAYSTRIIPRWWLHFFTKLSLLGYAIPGAILGVVLLSMKGFLHQYAGDTAQWIFHTTVTGLILAYAIRFLTVGYNPIEAGFKNIPTNLDDVSATLGRKKFSSLLHIHLPLLKPSMLAAMIILFIDILKELPLTLILGPSNNDTLATRTYGLFAAEERIPEGSIPALILIFTSLVGLLILLILFNNKTFKSP